MKKLLIIGLLLHHDPNGRHADGWLRHRGRT